MSSKAESCLKAEDVLKEKKIPKDKKRQHGWRNQRERREFLKVGGREKAQDKDLNLVTVSLFWKVRERAQRGRRGSATPETA